MCEHVKSVGVCVRALLQLVVVRLVISRATPGVLLGKSPRGGKSMVEDILGGGVRIVSNIQF